MRQLVLAALLVALPAGAVDIQYVAIRDAGNPADTASNCLGDASDCGSVPYDYAISRYEITNAQYAAFLTAVAVPDDTFGLYNADMSISPFFEIPTGLLFYFAQSGHENEPVAYVSFYDALRFANWLHNGQPPGEQGPGTTEDGAYTITADGINQNTITRNQGAQAFVPSENEWYKAAYYDPTLDAGLGDYFDYPTGTDTPTTCTMPTADPSTANCNFAVGSVTSVGSYSGSPSPYGTFDQGGNVFEWDEQIAASTARGTRGGGWGGMADDLVVSARFGTNPTDEYDFLGFRVARPVPEPTQLLLVLTGGLVLAAARRQRRA